MPWDDVTTEFAAKTVIDEKCFDVGQAIRTIHPPNPRRHGFSLIQYVRHLWSNIEEQQVRVGVELACSKALNCHGTFAAIYRGDDGVLLIHPVGSHHVPLHLDHDVGSIFSMCVIT